MGDLILKKISNKILLVSNISLIKLAIIFCFFQYTFSTIVKIPQLDSIFAQIDDLLYIITIILALYLSNRKKIGTIKKSPIDLWVFLAFLYIGFASFLNAVPLSSIILSAKTYFSVWLVFFAILWTPYDINTLAITIKKLLFKLFFIEFIIQLGQVLIAVAQNNYGDDMAMGTFAGANTMSYSYFFPLFFSLYLFIFDQQKKLLKYVLLFISGMVLSWGMFAILVTPFLFIFFNSLSFIRQKKQLIRIAIIGPFLFIILIVFQNMNSMQKSIIEKHGALGFFSPSYLIEKLTVGEMEVHSGSARLLWFPVTYDRLNKFAYSPLIGMGPGMYASYAAQRIQAPPQRSIENIFGQLELGLDTGVDSQIIATWGEFGSIGLALTFLFLLSQIYLHFKIWRKLSNPLGKGFALTASAGSAYLIIGMYVNQILQTQQFILLYVIFSACSIRFYYSEKNHTIASIKSA